MTIIDSIKYTDEYTGSIFGGPDAEGVGNLMGAVGDLIVAEINFHVSWSSLNIPVTTDVIGDTWVRSDYNDWTNKDPGTSSYIRKDFGTFIGDGFKVGDSIVVVGASGNNGNYIISSLSSNQLMTTSTMSTSGAFGSVNIYGTTPMNVFDLYYTQTGNILGNLSGASNNESFTSLSDTSVQKFSGVASPSASYLEPNATSLAWWDNIVSGMTSKPSIVFLGTDSNFNQNFSATFSFLIQPFYLSGQAGTLRQALSGKVNPPSYWNDLNFSYKIDSKECMIDKTRHTTGVKQDITGGNVSWFNSFFPKGSGCTSSILTKTQYVLNASYTADNTTGKTGSIDFNRKTDILLSIKNKSGLGVTASKVVLNFMYLPNDPSTYQNFSESEQMDYRKAFLHDRVMLIEGGSASNGDQYGTPYQVITNAFASVDALDPNNLIVVATMNFGSQSKSVLNNAGLSDRNYMVWATPQDASVKSLETSNRNAVIGVIDNAYTNTDNPNLLYINTHLGTQSGTSSVSDVYFFRYPDVDKNPVTNFTDYNGAFSYAKCDFLVDNTAIIDSIGCRFDVQVLLGTSSTIVNQFTLESWNNITSGFYDGKTTQIDITSDRGYGLSSSQYTIRSIERDANNDTATQSAYELIYPFQLGYQYWNRLNEFPDEFAFLPTQYWSTYTTGGTNIKALPSKYTSDIKFIISWDIQDSNGISTTFERYCDVAAYDRYATSSTTEFSTYDVFGNEFAGDIIAGDVQTEIQIGFIGNNAGTPQSPYTKLTGELVLFRENGISSVYDRSSTEEPNLVGSVWIGQPTITGSGSNATLTGILDLTTISPAVTGYRLYGKLGYKI